MFVKGRHITISTSPQAFLTLSAIYSDEKKVDVAMRTLLCELGLQPDLIFSGLFLIKNNILIQKLFHL